MPSAANEIYSEEEFPTAEAFLSALDPLNRSWQDSTSRWIFRGQRLTQWNLRPSILRRDLQRKFKLCAPLTSIDFTKNTLRKGEGDSLLDCELSLVQQFYEQSDKSGLSLPEVGEKLREQKFLVGLRKDFGKLTMGIPRYYGWPRSELNTILALAQHYGIPTRLLDWTWKPRVAAYFASIQAAQDTLNVMTSSEKLAVWALSVDFISSQIRYLLDDPNEDMDQDGNLRFSIVTAPQGSNQNLRAQAGLFVVDRSIMYPKPLDELIIERAEDRLSSDVKWFFNILTQYPHLKGWTPALRKLILPHTEARKLVRLLAIEGISAATVFPGYAGVVQSIDEQRYWDR